MVRLSLRGCEAWSVLHGGSATPGGEVLPRSRTAPDECGHLRGCEGRGRGPEAERGATRQGARRRRPHRGSLTTSNAASWSRSRPKPRTSISSRSLRGREEMGRGPEAERGATRQGARRRRPHRGSLTTSNAASWSRSRPKPRTSISSRSLSRPPRSCIPKSMANIGWRAYHSRRRPIRGREPPQAGPHARGTAGAIGTFCLVTGAAGVRFRPRLPFGGREGAFGRKRTVPWDTAGEDTARPDPGVAWNVRCPRLLGRGHLPLRPTPQPGRRDPGRDPGRDPA